MKEMELVRYVIDYINIKGHRAWRNNAGAIPIQGKSGNMRYIKIGEKGLPDVIGYTKTGQFIGIECKIKPNKPSPEQKEQLFLMKEAGCVTGVVYTPEDIEELL